LSRINCKTLTNSAQIFTGFNGQSSPDEKAQHLVSQTNRPTFGGAQQQAVSDYWLHAQTLEGVDPFS